jgi:UDP-N-acetylmuramoyl-L-alanyl-D-glutamate--2,6-diaminopimelate ligase
VTTRLLQALRDADLLVSAPAPDAMPALAALSTDSRSVRDGTLFIAVRGSQSDGHRFVSDATARGAAALVLEAPAPAAVPQIIVRDGRRAATVLALAWYGHPAASMTLIGITGTNGKTTTTALARHLLNRSGETGSIGTLGCFDGSGASVPSAAGSLTTPGPIDLQATFAALRDRGVRRVVMETSSHSLDQGRLDGLVFQCLVFTNLTRDHLDYHGTMAAYQAAKLRLLDLATTDSAVALNADDPAWASVPRNGRTVTFGTAASADVRAVDLECQPSGSRFRIEGRFGIRDAELPLPGDFNVWNALAAAAAGLGMGLGLDEIVQRLADAPQVSGRMERITATPFTVLRDYAHTPDALRRALETLRSLTRGRLIVLFGCGGDRDRGKRPLMAQAAAAVADFMFLTSDNPRTEDPDRILDEIQAGLPPGAPHLRITDRRTAIAAALEEGKPGDTLLLAGKGHENYQVIGTETRPFDERVVVRELLDGR